MYIMLTVSQVQLLLSHTCTVHVHVHVQLLYTCHMLTVSHVQLLPAL